MGAKRTAVAGPLLVAGIFLGACHARLAPVPAITPPPTGLSGNHSPTVAASAERDHVKPGERIALTATAYDPDGDRLSLRWSAAAGTFNNPAGARTYWTAPAAGGAVTITFRADDGRGEPAATSLQITVEPR